MHAEAVGTWEGVSTLDSDVRTVFNWAAVMLLTGASEVLIWVSGSRNVAVKVNRENYKQLREMWVEEGVK